MPGPPAHLKPERLELDPTETDADKKFKHWLRTFTNYSNGVDAADKLNLLINFVGHKAYSLIENSDTYDSAIDTLKSSYTKEINVIYASHILATRKQHPDKSLDDYMRNLRLLAKDCQFEAVSAQVYHDECVRQFHCRSSHSLHPTETPGKCNSHPR